MEILVVSFAALLASMLTLFSGFGLGTLLMPIVAIFFSVDVAIAITAVVHLANNLFKGVLFRTHVNKEVLISFGVPAVILAFLGALILGWLSSVPAVFEYAIFGKEFEVYPIKLVIGIIILVFVILELTPSFANIKMDKKYLPFGGALSGFFGGLSGHQGAFRSMFLIKAGLTKEEFVSTGIMIAVIVDISRMLVYGWDISLQNAGIDWLLVTFATISAFFGAFFGAKILKKVTIKTVQLIVSILLIIVSLGLIGGVI